MEPFVEDRGRISKAVKATKCRPGPTYIHWRRQRECGIFALPALVGAGASMEYGAHGLLVMVKLPCSFSRDEIRSPDLGLTRFIRNGWNTMLTTKLR